MEEYSEAEAYKHLLSIAENILNSVQTDSNILDKYHKLKTAVLSKLTPDPTPTQLAAHRKLLATYKYLASSSLQVIAEFQAEIEAEMSRTAYSKKVIGIAKEWELRLDELRQLSVEGKQRVVFKEELSALTYYCSELDSKFENLGLLIEVHRKMHEIICQAAQGETDKSRREQQMARDLRNLQEQVSEIRNAKRFLQLHRMSQDQHSQLAACSQVLASLLHPSVHPRH